MSNQIKHKRPKYNLEFKQDAAKLVIEKNYTHQQAADCNGLGVPEAAAGLFAGFATRRCEQKILTTF